MPDGQMHGIVEYIRGLVVAPDLASLTDSDLLERFRVQRDESAFEALVRRHGPMVLGLCRRILHDPQDAEDAFQATFLVFVRKSGSIAKPELLGNWLYGVASRTARVARKAAEKRRAKEDKAVPHEQRAEASLWQEFQPFLDYELSRLPAKYRVPVILCHLEEKSRHEAAQALGVPEGTLSSRLARARTLLAQRLARRCPTLTGGALFAGLGPQATAAALPASLVQTTVKAGMRVLGGRALSAGLVSAQVALLSEGVVRAMFLTKLKIIATIVCLGGLLTLGIGTVASRSLGTGDETSKAAGAPKDESSPLVKLALETARTVTDPEAKLRVLLRVAAVQFKTGDLTGARKTRQEAFEFAKSFAVGIPRADALLKVAWSQIEAKDRSAVVETLKHAEQAVTPIEGESERPTWLARLIGAQATAGDYEGGLRTLAKGEGFQGTLLSQFGFQLNTENKEAARKAITQAQALVKFEDKRSSERTNGLSGVAYALLKVGDLNQALETAAKLGNEQDGCLEIIAAAQARDGDIAGAVRTAKSIQQDDAKADALEAIARAQAKAGDLTAARSTVKEVRELVEKLQQAEIGRQAERGRPRRQPFFPSPEFSKLSMLQARIAFTQLLLGDKSGALVTAASITSDLQKADALLEMGRNRLTAGKPNEPREMLVAASEAAQRAVPAGPQRYWPAQNAKAARLQLIAREQVKVGDIKEAFKTANSIPTDQAMDDALAAIAPAQAEAGDRKGALDTIARIRAETSKATALEGVAEILVQTGHEKDAVDLAAKQASSVHKAYALLGVVLGKTKVKAPKE
jgi:RNA polymerase sigma factor (sigma-70 family)